MFFKLLGHKLRKRLAPIFANLISALALSVGVDRKPLDVPEEGLKKASKGADRKRIGPKGLRLYPRAGLVEVSRALRWPQLSASRMSNDGPEFGRSPERAAPSQARVALTAPSVVSRTTGASVIVPSGRPVWKARNANLAPAWRCAAYLELERQALTSPVTMSWPSRTNQRETTTGLDHDVNLRAPDGSSTTSESGGDEAADEVDQQRGFPVQGDLLGKLGHERSSARLTREPAITSKATGSLAS